MALNRSPLAAYPRVNEGQKQFQNKSANDRQSTYLSEVMCQQNWPSPQRKAPSHRYLESWAYCCFDPNRQGLGSVVGDHQSLLRRVFSQSCLDQTLRHSRSSHKCCVVFFRQSRPTRAFLALDYSYSAFPHRQNCP
ncbi:Uncharacterised protein [Vibrio cholerae]|uniref:Uncharacterized protein n=1 Tax=Vibrio cholerae TaxID=666 RepID=A0A655VP65_VIBCL|nr:Uncharacterised protein [Vibrio cholerae]CSC04848.1 Uncharacterised protein [Vibrio cholerae]CSD08537.1 Uncharacterised protein [Vibrio cholerae]